MKRTFGAFDIVPNGVLLFEVSKQAVSFANKEMYILLGLQAAESEDGSAQAFARSSESQFLQEPDSNKKGRRHELLASELRNFKRSVKDDDSVRGSNLNVEKSNKAGKKAE